MAGSPQKMQAAVYHGRRDIRVEEMPVPVPVAGELVLEVHAAGVGGTDAHEYADGPVMYPITQPHPISGHSGPMIPGHEFGGRVVAVGDGVDGFALGDLVASGAGISCGECDRCQLGQTNLCIRYATSGLQRHGGLAQYVAVPASVCLDVGRLGLTDDGAGIVQPMSIAAHSMRRGRPEAGDQGLVIGVGGVGAFLVYALSEMGVDVVAADLDQSRLEIAAALGAGRTIVASRSEPLAALAPDLVGGPPVAYEVSGTKAGLDAAIDIVRPGGRVVAIGLHHGPVETDLRSVTLRELEVIGTNAHAFDADVPEAARLIASRREGWSDVAPLALPLREMVERALVPLSDGTSSRIKNLIDPWAEQERPTVY